MAGAVGGKAVVSESNIVTSGSVDILNSLRNCMAYVTHIDILRNPDNTYNILMKGYLVLDNNSGEVYSVRDRLFFGKEEFGVRFNGRVTWWFTNPEKIIDPLMAHINFNTDDWNTESQVEIIRCKRSIEKLS